MADAGSALFPWPRRRPTPRRLTTLTVDGVIYSNVTWGAVTPATVTVFHETGVGTIPLEKLPPELQKRFGYDPDKANQYRIAEAAAQAESAKRLAEGQAEKKLQQQREKERKDSGKRNLPQPPAQPPTVSVVGVIKFASVEMQATATGENRAILTGANGEKTTVVFDANGCDFLDRCSAQRAAWERQQADLGRNAANAVDLETADRSGRSRTVYRCQLSLFTRWRSAIQRISSSAATNSSIWAAPRHTLGDPSGSARLCMPSAIFGQAMFGEGSPT